MWNGKMSWAADAREEPGAVKAIVFAPYRPAIVTASIKGLTSPESE
jgi:hypothetical protein